MGIETITREEARKLWVAALRSGKYSQCQGFLAVIDRGEVAGHCCLGVACDVYIKAGGELRIDSQNDDDCIRFDSIVDVLPRKVKGWLGINDSAGEYIRRDEPRRLVDDNDEGMSFAEIADIIESKPPGLFVS